MRLQRRSVLRGLGLLSVFGTRLAAGQGRYPDRPVTLVVASAPGGQSDLIARYLAAEVARDLGQPVIVENRAGASGIIGLQYAARQAPDGYTIAYGVGSWIAVNPGFFPNLPYNPAKDFVAITQIGTTPQCLLIGSHLPARTLPELIKLAKDSPGKLTFASFGSGSTSHLQGELLKRTAGIDMVHVPFKGSAQALTEVIAGRIDMMIIDFAPATAFIEQGRLIPLAVTGTIRYPEFPQVPTFQELGYPLTLVGWNGLFAPTGTPDAVIRLLNERFNSIIQSRAGREKLLQLGALPTGTTPAEFQNIVLGDIGKWAEIIRASGAKPD